MNTANARRLGIAPIGRAAKRPGFPTSLAAGLLALVAAGCGRQGEPPDVSRPPPVVNREPTRAPQPVLPTDAPDGELSRAGGPRPPESRRPSRGRTASESAATTSVDPFTDNALPWYELQMDPADVTRLDRSGRSNETFPATFVAGGQTYRGARVRLRGDWARTWPKKCLKIFFADDALFEGQDRINLNSGWRDPALVREPLAYRIYAACGVPASRSRLVGLRLNGQFRGLYVEVEQPDKYFLRRVGRKGAAIYKANSRSNRSDERDLGAEQLFASHYEKETQKSEGYGDLREFCRDLARATNALDFFAQRVELDTYINYLAATVLVQNWDCYNKNHFIVHDRRGSGKWLAVPWDLDRTMGDHWHQYFTEASVPVFHGTRESPGPTGWNRLAERFFQEPVLRARFLDRLGELLEQEFTTEKLFPILDQFEAAIGPTAKLDRRRWPGADGDLHEGIAQLKTYVEQRRAFLRREVTRLRREIRRIPPPASSP